MQVKRSVSPRIKATRAALVKTTSQSVDARRRERRSVLERDEQVSS